MDSDPSFPPPPPPPLPGSIGAIHIPTYKEQQQMKQQQQNNSQNNVNEDQFANLPPQLMSTMNKDKKPFTYTPNSLIGEKGLLDLSQIKSPRMKKRLLENQKDDEEQQQQQHEDQQAQQQQQQVQQQVQQQKQQPQYFPVSPPRKLNILQEIKEQQQYQPEQQRKAVYSPVTPPQQQPYSPVTAPQFQQQYSPVTPLQQQPQFQNYPPQSPLKQYESTLNQMCSTPVYTNLNQQPKPFQRQNEEWFPQYTQQQQYFNVTPPKKIDIFKEIKEQPTSPKTPISAPTLQEQWQQRKLQSPIQQQSPVKHYSQQPMFSNDYAEQQNPIQSKSFKVLQQIVKDNEEPQQQQQQWKNKYEEEAVRRPTIPSNSFRYLQSMVGISEEEASQQHRQRIIPIQIERQNSQQQQLYLPPSQRERIKTPPTYQGASIPSRSFRLLQIMTDDEQQQQQQQYMQQHRMATTGFEGTDF